ncbi:unnamed protein product, partial [Ectocarpus fasciculatus]
MILICQSTKLNSARPRYPEKARRNFLPTPHIHPASYATSVSMHDTITSKPKRFEVGRGGNIISIFHWNLDTQALQPSVHCPALSSTSNRSGVRRGRSVPRNQALRHRFTSLVVAHSGGTLS